MNVFNETGNPSQMNHSKGRHTKTLLSVSHGVLFKRKTQLKQLEGFFFSKRAMRLKMQKCHSLAADLMEAGRLVTGEMILTLIDNLS